MDEPYTREELMAVFLARELQDGEQLQVGVALPVPEAAVRLAAPYQAPEHQPLKLEFHMCLATSYQLMDQVGNARKALEEVVRRWPDHVEARLQLGQLLLSTCQLKDGLEVYSAHAVDEEPGTYYFFEIYRDADAFAAHGKGDGMRAAMVAFGGLLAGRPEITMLTPVAAKGLAL